MSKPLVSTRLQTPTYRALQEIAQQQERTVAFLVRKAVERFVAQQKEEKKGRQAA